MDQVRIGKFIAELRKEKNMTQLDLANKIGVSDRAISKWENGRGMPDYSILKDLCSNLGISINELINGERIKKEKIVEEYDHNLINVLKEYKKMKKQKNIILIVLGILGVYLIQSICFMIFLYITFTSAKVEVNTDITKYNDYIGLNAKEEYRNKWDMDETIFPSSIKKSMNVLDYKMVYYNPWDAQYLSYLVVEYNDEDYLNEINRLKEYESTNYIGNYSVTGFSKYNLLAMYADSYQGFVYAITDNKNKIIYVELIFCNYAYDLDYKKYINMEYLPDGFDATMDNAYGKAKIKE